MLRLPDAPDTILFDLDGTLLDSSRPVHAAWDRALTGMGLPTLPVEQLNRVIGPPMLVAAPELLRERGRDDDASFDEFIARFREAITEVEVEQALAYPGTVELLHALHGAGRRLAVVTSKPMQAAERVVPALGIADLFVHLEAPDRADPEPKTVTLARALAVLDLPGDQTVLVGDRHHDVEAGLAHGVATIGVTWGGFGTHEELTGAGAAVVVERPEHLPPLLGIA